jgi:hypothetical protein
MKNEGPPVTIEIPDDDDDTELDKKKADSSTERPANFLSRLRKEKEQKQSERFTADLKNVFPSLVTKEDEPTKPELAPGEYELVEAPTSITDDDHEYLLDTSPTREEPAELPAGYRDALQETAEAAPATEPPAADYLATLKPAEALLAVTRFPELPKPSAEAPDTSPVTEVNPDGSTPTPETASEPPAAEAAPEAPSPAPTEGEPPTPPPPPPETTPAFGGMPPVPPGGGRNFGGPNFNNAPLPVPTPRVERVPTPAARRETWGPVALVAAVAVDLMSRGRDRKIRRNQAKQNRRLEKMIKETDRKRAALESRADNQPKPAVQVIEQPTIVTKEQIIPKVATQPEAAAIAKQQREQLQAAPSKVVEHTRTEESPSVGPLPELRPTAEYRPSPSKTERQPLIVHQTKEVERTLAEQRDSPPTEKTTETLREHQVEKAEEVRRTQEVEKLTEKRLVEELIEKEIVEKKKQKLPEMVFDQRHEIKDDPVRDLPAETLGFRSNTLTSDSQPVTHIATILADKQRAALRQDEQSLARTPQPAKDLTKQYVTTGFIAALIIAIGVALIITLR